MYITYAIGGKRSGFGFKMRNEWKPGRREETGLPTFKTTTAYCQYQMDLKKKEVR
jgi:hypothetical protein